MKTKSDYIIKKISDKQYEIAKFLDGEYNTTYKVLLEQAETTCNCISGHIRGYCKHKDWIRDLLEGRLLPNNVELAKHITEQDLDTLVKEVGL